MKQKFTCCSNTFYCSIYSDEGQWVQEAEDFVWMTTYNQKLHVVLSISVIAIFIETNTSIPLQLPLSETGKAININKGNIGPELN